MAPVTSLAWTAGGRQHRANAAPWSLDRYTRWQRNFSAVSVIALLMVSGAGHGQGQGGRLMQAPVMLEESDVDRVDVRGRLPPPGPGERRHNLGRHGDGRNLQERGRQAAHAECPCRLRRTCDKGSGLVTITDPKTKKSSAEWLFTRAGDDVASHTGPPRLCAFVDAYPTADPALRLDVDTISVLPPPRLETVPVPTPYFPHHSSWWMRCGSWHPPRGNGRRSPGCHNPSPARLDGRHFPNR